MKKTLALILALLMLLALAGCAVNGTTAADDATAGMAPAEAAEAALDTTQDKMGISDIVRVPFGYLLDWLDRFANNYGVALILFSLIVKLVLLPMSIKGKKSMLKMSRLARWPRRSKKNTATTSRNIRSRFPSSTRTRAFRWAAAACGRLSRC